MWSERTATGGFTLIMAVLAWKGVTTRRAAAIGAAALILLAVLAIALSGDRDEDPGTGPAPAPEPAGPVARAPAIGASLRRPPGWRVRRTRRSLTLRSPDRSVLISVSLPPRAGRSAAVLRDAAAAARRAYGAKLQPGRGRTLAGLPTVTAVASGANRSGTAVQILIAAVQGNRRAWLVQVFSAPGRDAGRRLVQAQVALGTLRLRG